MITLYMLAGLTTAYGYGNDTSALRHCRLGLLVQQDICLGNYSTHSAPLRLSEILFFNLRVVEMGLYILLKVEFVLMF